MPDSLPSLRRRRVLQLIPSLPALAAAGPPRASPPAAASAVPQINPLSAGATLLVGGPQGGQIDSWSRILEPLLSRGLVSDGSLQQTNVGGADGVTAANQFEARAAPDGQIALMTPGDAATAWLIGDPRAKFDASRWVPVLAAVTPVMLVGRPGLLQPGRTVRVAADRVTGPEVTGMLAIELLGARPQPVTGFADEEAVRRAFATNAIDAVLLHGHKVAEQARDMKTGGGVPLMALDPAGVCPSLDAEIPSMRRLCTSVRGGEPNGALLEAWQALAAATQLEFGLMLPRLTPAALVAVWRRAASDAADAIEVQSVATSFGVRALGGAGSASCTAALSVSAEAMLALRQWLGEHFLRRRA